MKFDKPKRKRRKSAKTRRRSSKKEISGVIEHRKGLWFRMTSMLALSTLIILLFVNSQKQAKASLRSSDEKSMSNPADIQKIIHSIEDVVLASSFNHLEAPMEEFSLGVHCPNKNGGGRNKFCSKGYSEYLFKVSPGKKYYAYVETIAPTIWDNSLWIGVEGANQARFESCPKITIQGESDVPHKHIKQGKFLCCPKYLKKNERKGKDEFYSSCCFNGLGQGGEDKGCVLDLEVGEKGIWNMLPRIIQAKEEVLSLKVFAREDGTAITKLFLSRSPRLHLNS